MTAMTMGAAGSMAGRSASLNNRTINAVAVDPADAEAQFRVNTDGTIEINTGSGWTEISDFAGGSGWDVKVDVTGATLDGDSSATGTWLTQTTQRRWSQTRTTIGVDSTVCTISVRNPDDTVVDTAVYTLVAEVEV